jgi:hypothetical protein
VLGFSKLRRLRRTAARDTGVPAASSAVDAADAGRASEEHSSLHSQDGSRHNGSLHAADLRRGSLLDRLVPVAEFISVEPILDRGPLKPPTFTSFRIPETSAYLGLRAELSPIKLFGSAALAETAMATGTLALEPVLPQPVQPPREIPARDPLWFSLDASSRVHAEEEEEHDFTRAALEDTGPQAAPLEFADSAAAQGLDPAAGDGSPLLDDDSIYDSPLPFREYTPARRSRPWQAIENFFLSRAFSQAVAVCVLALFVSTLDVPWKNWMDRQVQRVKDPISSIANNLSRPIKERSAFFIVDDFSGGLENWLENRALSLNDSGQVAVKQGLALHSGTLNLESYRMDFEAKIESQAVGWVVRAADTDNYYAFKLVEKSRDSFDLLRYTVVEGARDAAQGVASISVPANLASAADFNRISVRVRDNQITTLINGWGVDFWQNDRFDRGGVGLLADRGESALVRKMSIAGNEDTWGLILYGTLETIRSVQDTFSAPVALQMEPGPAGLNAAMVLHPASQPFLLTGGR